MKILFLDIDGVLNTAQTYHFSMIEDKLVINLDFVLQRTGAVIVVSSTWRNNWHLKDLANLLVEHGLSYPERLIDSTPSDEETIRTLKLPRDYNRGDCIDLWLRRNGRPKNYAVVDDNEDAAKIFGLSKRHPFVKTEFDDGLTIEKAEELIQLLGEE